MFSFSLRDFMVSSCVNMIQSWYFRLVPLGGRVVEMLTFLTETQQVLGRDSDLEPPTDRQIAEIMYRIRNHPDIEVNYFRALLDTVFPSNLRNPFAYTQDQLHEMARFLQNLVYAPLWNDEPVPIVTAPAMDAPKPVPIVTAPAMDAPKPMPIVTAPAMDAFVETVVLVAKKQLLFMDIENELDNTAFLLNMHENRMSKTGQAPLKRKVDEYTPTVVNSEEKELRKALYFSKIDQEEADFKAALKLSLIGSCEEEEDELEKAIRLSMADA
jgi:hypothetical protein